MADSVSDKTHLSCNLSLVLNVLIKAFLLIFIGNFHLHYLLTLWFSSEKIFIARYSYLTVIKTCPVTAIFLHFSNMYSLQNLPKPKLEYY